MSEVPVIGIGHARQRGRCWNSEIRKQLLKSLPATRKELQRQLKISKSYAGKLVSEMKEANKVFVCEWKDGEEVLSIGHGIDAPRPAPISRAERAARELAARELAPTSRHGSDQLMWALFGGRK